MGSERIRIFAAILDNDDYMEGNMSITANEPATAYQPVSATDVLAYIHSVQMSNEDRRMVSRQLRREVDDEHLIWLKNRLEEMNALKKGWDGYDALPINKEIIKLIRELLELSPASYLSDWTLSPNLNATVLLETDIAVISIGKENMSYAIEGKSGFVGREDIPVSVENILSVIRLANQYAEQ